MSKRKKIFHKPQEEIPSAEDILNYLNEETTPVPSPKKKSSPKGGAKERSRKMEMDESSMDDLLSNKDEEKKEIEVQEEVMKSSPSPSMESFSKSILGGSEGGSQKNKKKHELEKVMLSEPLISDAVEGYALLGDRKKAKTLIDEINQNIASQTSKKNNRTVIMRIAAILLILFLISGGSFYLFDQMSGNKLAEVSNETASPVGNILSDSVAVANQSEIKPDNTKTDELALEREEAKKTLGETYKFENKPGNSDGYVINEKNTTGPTDEESFGNGNGLTSGTLSTVHESEKKEDRKELFKNSAPVERSIATDTSRLIKDIDLAYQDDVGELVEEDKVSPVQTQRSSERSREPSKNKKAKSKGDNAPAAKTQTESFDATIPSGTSRKGYLLEDGIRLYNQGKYTEAKEVLQGVLATQPSNQEAMFYNGLSEYKLKKYEVALAYLAKIIPASKRYDEARWNMALIYLETGKKEEAKNLLKELSKTGNSYSEKAFEELKKLE